MDRNFSFGCFYSNYFVSGKRRAAFCKLDFPMAYFFFLQIGFLRFWFGFVYVKSGPYFLFCLLGAHKSKPTYFWGLLLRGNHFHYVSCFQLRVDWRYAPVYFYGLAPVSYVAVNGIGKVECGSLFRELNYLPLWC